MGNLGFLGSAIILATTASIIKETIPKKNMDYCPKCRKRKEHIKVLGMKICKTCGYQEKQ